MGSLCPIIIGPVGSFLMWDYQVAMAEGEVINLSFQCLVDVAVVALR